MGKLERFVEDLNLSLVDLEQRQSVYGEPQPIYFVVGAPRSGTTILTQVMAYCYQFGYITNIAARFYLAPVVGCKLSEHILGSTHEHIRFWSQYANTEHPGDVHEFGWFWQYCLDMKDASSVHLQMSTMSYNVTQRHLLSLCNHFGKPIVMKGIYPAYFKPMIDQMLGGNAVWVNIERDPLDCCASIYNVCQNKNLGWFGWYPPVNIYDDLKKMSLKQRIAGQVAFFRHFYRHIADHTVQYQQLCACPHKTLFEIKKLDRCLPSTALYYSDYGQDELEGWREIYDRAQADLGYASA